MTRTVVEFYPVRSIFFNENYKKIDNNVFNLVQSTDDLLRDIDSTIIYIKEYDGTAEEKSKAIKDICDKYRDGNYLIYTAAYVHLNEYPPDKYYIIPFDEPDEQRRRHPVLFIEMIDKESTMLEELGFIDISNIIPLFRRRAFIYPNEIGKKVLGLLGKTNPVDSAVQ